jgi:hypothetical protein
MKTYGWELEMSCKLHDPAALPPGEKARGTHWVEGWVDPTAGQDNIEKWKFLTLPGLEPLPLGRPPVIFFFFNFK